MARKRSKKARDFLSYPRKKKRNNCLQIYHQKRREEKLRRLLAGDSDETITNTTQQPGEKPLVPLCEEQNLALLIEDESGIACSINNAEQLEPPESLQLKTENVYEPQFILCPIISEEPNPQDVKNDPLECTESGNHPEQLESPGLDLKIENIYSVPDSDPELNLQELRLVNLGFVIEQMLKLGNHGTGQCGTGFMKIVAENRCFLKSCVTLLCTMCNEKFDIMTHTENDQLN